jgi:hypothetical protein
VGRAGGCKTEKKNATNYGMRYDPTYGKYDDPPGSMAGGLNGAKI